MIHRGLIQRHRQQAEENEQLEARTKLMEGKMLEWVEKVRPRMKDNSATPEERALYRELLDHLKPEGRNGCAKPGQNGT